MTKLVDLLKKHFKGVWPKDCVSMVQDSGGQVWMNDETGSEDFEYGYWYSNYYDDFQLPVVSDDFATAVVTKEQFEEKQEESQLNKIDIVAEYLNTDHDMSKEAFARKYNTSARSLGRWIEKYACEVIKTGYLDEACDCCYGCDTCGDDEWEDAAPYDYVETEPEIHFTGTSQSITMYRGEESVTVHRDQSNFQATFDALMSGDLEEAWITGNVKAALEKFSEGSVEIINGIVYVKGFEVVNSMTERLVSMMENGVDGVRTFARFFENLMKVQDKRVVEELYNFLQHNAIKLNEDGSFTGYKAVREDYLDKYTGKINNTPGVTVEMPRSLVDDDKDRTCSVGLHVGNIDYVKMYGSGCSDRIVTVKVWPEDVVSVPSDYQGQKLRACKYTVIEDVTEQYK